MTVRMRGLSPRSVAMLGVVLWAVGCARGGPGVLYDPSDPVQQEQARLELVEPSPDDPVLVLGYEQTGRIRVRLTLEDGTPIEGAPVRFEVPPAADLRGSRLAASEARTDEDGIAEMSVMSGTESASFAVQPTFREERLTVTVAVSDVTKGRIRVSMRYDGTQPLELFAGTLYRGARCDELRPGSMPVPMQTAPRVGAVTAPMVFVDLDPSDDYAVFVMAYLEGELFAAYGCADRIAVMERAETPVNVTLSDIDLPPRFEGVYDLSNRLDFGDALPGNAGAALRILAELYDDDALSGDPATDQWGQDPGAFVVDLAMRQTCAWRCLPSEDYGSCSNLDHAYGDLKLFYLQDFQRWNGAQARFFGGCGGWAVRWSGRTAAEHAQVWVNDQIADLIPESARRFAATASDLARALTDARITSVLTLTPGHARSTIPFRHELLRMEVDVRDLGGETRYINFALRDAGLSSVLATGTATADGTRLNLPTHEFRLHYGRLLSYIWKEMLRLYGYASTAELIASWIDCDAVAASLAARVDLITEDQFRNACNAGIAAAGRFVENRIAEVGGTTSIYLQGSAIGTDISTDEIVQRLVMGEWSGMWGEEGGTGEISGTFDGMRRTSDGLSMGGM